MKNWPATLSTGLLKNRIDSLMEFSEEQIKKYETFLKYHLGENFADLNEEDQQKLLKARDRRFNLLMIINVVALIFFSYWFLADVTQLSDIIFYVLLAVFLLNMLSVGYQKKMLGEVKEYVRSRQG